MEIVALGASEFSLQEMPVYLYQAAALLGSGRTSWTQEEFFAAYTDELVYRGGNLVIAAIRNGRFRAVGIEPSSLRGASIPSDVWVHATAVPGDPGGARHHWLSVLDFKDGKLENDAVSYGGSLFLSGPAGGTAAWINILIEDPATPSKYLASNIPLDAPPKSVAVKPHDTLKKAKQFLRERGWSGLTLQEVESWREPIFSGTVSRRRLAAIAQSLGIKPLTRKRPVVDTHDRAKQLSECQDFVMSGNNPQKNPEKS